MKYLKEIAPAIIKIIGQFHESVIIINRNSEIVYSNDQALKMFKYDDLDGKQLDILIPQMLSGRHRQHVQKFIDKETTVRKMGQDLRVSGITSEGYEFPAEASIARLDTDSKEPLAMVIMRDISDRFPSQEISRLDHDTEQIMQAFDRLKDNIVVLDSNWRYRYLNEAALKRLGKQKNELIGKSIWELFPYLIGTPFEEIAKKSKKDKQERVLEDFYPSTGYWYRSRITPFDSQIMLHITDITELKRAQESNSIMARTLEQALESDWDRKDYRDYSNTAHW